MGQNTSKPLKSLSKNINIETLQKKAHTINTVSKTVSTLDPVLKFGVVASGLITSAAVPFLAPAIIGTIIITLYVLRQKDLNRVLMMYLVSVKSELERIWRIYSVMNIISEENNIPIDTTKLNKIIENMRNNILKFADKNTKTKLKELTPEIIKETLSTVNTNPVNTHQNRTFFTRIKNTTRKIKNSAVKKWDAFTVWSKRWLTPKETVEEIEKQMIEINLYFTIMLGEFDIFMRYIGNSNKKEWIHREEFKSMLRILSDSKNVKDDDIFFGPIAIKNAIEDVKHNLVKQQTDINELPGITSNTNHLNLSQKQTQNRNQITIPNPLNQKTNSNQNLKGGSRNRKLTRKH